MPGRPSYRPDSGETDADRPGDGDRAATSGQTARTYHGVDAGAGRGPRTTLGDDEFPTARIERGDRRFDRDLHLAGPRALPLRWPGRSGGARPETGCRQARLLPPSAGPSPQPFPLHGRTGRPQGRSDPAAGSRSQDRPRPSRPARPRPSRRSRPSIGREPRRPRRNRPPRRAFRGPRARETHSVKRHLDVDAESYDAQIRRFIPHYDDMLATGVELLAVSRGVRARQDALAHRLRLCEQRQPAPVRLAWRQSRDTSCG
jgi:hypothetical protein